MIQRHSVSNRRDDSRRFRRVAAGVALVASLAACGGSKGASSSNGPDAVAPPATGVAASTLRTAVSKLGTSFHFETTVKVGTTTAIDAQGDRVGTGSRLVLTSSTGVVSYVITDAGSWAKPENGTWSKLDIAPAQTDPLAALSNASAVEQVAASGTEVQLALTVADSDLGIGDSGNATLTVMLDGGRLSTISYATKVTGPSAVVVTQFGKVVDGSPVVAPV